MMNYFSEDLKKILLAGVGAVALSAEKSKEVIDTLVKKGELTVEQGKVINEELKRNVKEKLKDPVDVDSVNRDLEKLDKDELEALKAKIEELQANNESE